jgi:glycyl-tRNA synthetase beta chain
LDTIAGFFAMDQRPSGSRDPFALRRAALSILALILKSSLRLNVRAVAEEAFQQIVVQRLHHVDTQLQKLEAQKDQLEATEMVTLKDGTEWHAFPNRVDLLEAPIFEDHGEALIAKILVSADEFVTNILDFLADRLKVQQREAGVRHDLIDAVFALGGEDDLVRLLARVKALQAFVGTEDGVNLLAGYKRATRVIPAQAGIHEHAASESGADSSTEVRMGSRLRGNDEVGVETALRTALDTAEPLAAAAIEAEDFASAMTALASLRAPIDAFFEGVMVNDPDPDKRAYRLGLLTRFRDAVHRVADFSKIEG